MGYDQAVTLERLKAITEILENEARVEVTEPTIEGLAATSFELLRVATQLREIGNDVYRHAEEIAERLTGEEVMADGRRAEDKVAAALSVIEDLIQNFHAVWKSSFDLGMATQTIEPGKSRLVDAPDPGDEDGEWVRVY